MIVNGLPHGFGFALFPRVQAPHYALQLGEFFDQLGGEIALGQPRGAGCGLIPAQFAHEFLDTLGLFEIRTQLGLERDVSQILHTIREFLLLIGFPEEASVVEARLQHAFIAAPDQSFRIGTGVHHRHKVPALPPRNTSGGGA